MAVSNGIDIIMEDDHIIYFILMNHEPYHSLALLKDNHPIHLDMEGNHPVHFKFVVKGKCLEVTTLVSETKKIFI